jgi:chorismate dehydratase
MLFTPHAMEKLAGATIELTGESATSINLLKVLLAQKHGITDCRFLSLEGTADAALSRGHAVLLIGDRALRLATAPPDHCKVFDLGQLWFELTGLPVVFAFWIVRKELPQGAASSLAELILRLQENLTATKENLEGLAYNINLPDGISVERAITYWQSMSYVLTDRHLAGFREFCRMCMAQGLLIEEPEIEFA